MTDIIFPPVKLCLSWKIFHETMIAPIETELKESLNLLGLPTFRSDKGTVWFGAEVLEHDGMQPGQEILSWQRLAKTTAFAVSLSMHGWPTAPTPEQIAFCIAQKHDPISSITPLLTTLIGERKISEDEAARISRVQAQLWHNLHSELVEKKEKKLLPFSRQAKEWRDEYLHFEASALSGNIPKIKAD